ncbi:MAG: hypothetical protein AB1487_05450 [Thermodesulfobacteriota bacterium]
MPKTIFNPVLFWDGGEIDLEKHADYVIARILDYGDERDLKALRRLYSDEKIIQVVKTRKGLSPRTRSFWILYFQIQPEEIT